MATQPKLPCPACGALRAAKGMARHTNACKKWSEVIGVPPSEFNFDQHFKRALYAEGLVEGEDYVVCQVCAAEGADVRKLRLMDHLKKVHKLTESSYKVQHPGARVRVASTAQKRQKTVQERFGVDNVFQAEEVKEKSRETVQERFGVDHVARSEEVKRKKAETNIGRYGAENPFGSKQIQQKIRETHLERRGVENPNQDPKVVAKRVATNRERYGVDHFLQTEEFQEKFRETSRERFGVDHPMQSEEGYAHFCEAFREQHGVDSPFLSEEIQARAYATNLFNHGGKHSQQCPEVLAKARATWMEKYGVDNPSKAEEVKVRIKETWIRNYGVPFPPQSLWTNRENSFPNKLEQDVDEMSPASVVYSGDGSYWIRVKGASRSRNPDFVVLKRAQVRAYRDGAKLNDLRTSACIEIFGDYWHSKKFTGKARRDHRREVIAFYKAAGIECLVIWEKEVRKDPRSVAARLLRFVTRWQKAFEDEPPEGDVLRFFEADLGIER